MKIVKVRFLKVYLYNSLISLYLFYGNSTICFFEKLRYALARADGPILHLGKGETKGNQSSVSTLIHTG